jgi:hypothetical protein
MHESDKGRGILEALGARRWLRSSTKTSNS